MKRRRNEEKNEGKKWENERYIYTGEADLCKKSGEDIFGVLITSAEFLLEKLFNYIEEIVAWDFLINWGIEQISGLGSDRTEWSEDDYEALKGTISQFIPLIRFMDISLADFYDKVRPYKAAIPLHI
ncbi:uncharacterized protein OCT59_005595 [Rhizophagus irregularis]|uniref:uncharacterized protein n=1 Tax=Rhizophagus irregularis TaxID=588596 RepID=UPI00331B081F|nr:hypothetical protein OCT59_005595 [Rhizophagus irregularis]